MNNTYNEKTHTAIKQLLKKFSPKAPGFAYIASFDSGVTYKGTVGLASIGVPPAFRKKTTLRKSELKNQKIYHYSKTHTVSFFIQKIIQHNINCVVLGVIININLGV
ncbi:D-alanyl-D-alanine carboxypeptidase (plasmid) [Bacillus thuringiensis serovar thuringiensis str. IS5056]|nr:D-alanyl-D-alanine carboxypeptidase [Bacillus thuringiensis serovar thuringiensis str. IS5056]